MFFRRKKKTEPPAIEPAEVQTDALAGTAPDLVEVTDAAVETGAEITVEETEASLSAEAEEKDGALMTKGEAIRLFPGFERDDFEVGFRAEGEVPSLVMRWKDGGEWFTVPALFNRAVLAAMDERESQGDLHRLLRNYGYDVDGR